MQLSYRWQTSLAAAAIAVCALAAAAGQATAGYVQTNLVSDISGLATINDPALVNPWGISHSATSPFWTSNQGTNSATLYTVTGSTTVSKVTAVNPPNGVIAVPTSGNGPAQGPTGQVSNVNTSSFLVGNGGNGMFAHFIFANLNGTISAWDTGATAFIQAATAGASYTGLAINQAQTVLYAANDAGTGSINAFNSGFAPVSLAGNFTDPNLPTGLVPFNVQDVSGKVYVTYAPSGRPAQQTAAPGMGVVDVFDENGVFLQRLITGGQLAAPWGLALAPPTGFGQFSSDLLVGNFSYLNSEINAFNSLTGLFEGTIPVDPGSGQTAGGLWALGFGVGGSNGSPDTLYFADGIDSETHGLFAAIDAPEPSGLAVLGAAFALFAIWRGGRFLRGGLLRRA